jgi:hypothetical protein
MHFMAMKFSHFPPGPKSRNLWRQRTIFSYSEEREVPSDNRPREEPVRLAGRRVVPIGEGDAVEPVAGVAVDQVHDVVSDRSVRDGGSGEDLPVRLGPRRWVTSVKGETVFLCRKNISRRLVVSRRSVRTLDSRIPRSLLSVD